MPIYKAATASSPAPIAPSIGRGPEVIVSTPPVLVGLGVGVAVTVTVSGPVPLPVPVCDFKAVTSTAEYTISLAGMVPSVF